MANFYVICVLLLSASSYNDAASSSAVDTLDFYDKISVFGSKLTLDYAEKIYPSELVEVTDPEAHMTAPEIIEYYGYPVEVHKVTTKDGFILEMHRIPNGKSNSNDGTVKTPVLIMHGLAGSSAQWLLNTPKSSMGFVLADEGYDVWLGNVRGNSYSREHQSLSSKSREYWNISWQEIGQYDLPAMIDYILELTKQPKLAYVGHSTGCSSMAALLSTYPEYNSKITSFTAITPTVYVGLRNYLRFNTYITRQLEALTKTFHIYRWFPKGMAETIMTPKKGYMYQLEFAYMWLSLIAGYDRPNMNITRFPVYIDHLEAIPLRLFHHYAQIHGADSFQTYDDGELHGAKEYKLSAISAPVYIIWSPNDQLVTEDAIKKLESKLPNVKQSIRTSNPHYSHLDPYIGMDSKEVIVDEVIRILRANE